MSHRFALTFAAILILPVSSARAENGPYLAMRGGPVWAQNYTEGVVSIDPIDVDSVTLENRVGFHGDLVAGYRLGRFSFEVEASQKQARSGEVTNNLRPQGVIMAASQPYNAGSWNSRNRTRSLMANVTFTALKISANARDKESDRALHVVVGAGVGHAWIRQFGYRVSDGIKYDLTAGGRSFAWHGIGGIRYDLSRRLSLDASYKRFSVSRSLSPFQMSPQLYRDPQSWKGVLIGATYSL